jgi:hypothetical protein
MPFKPPGLYLLLFLRLGYGDDACIARLRQTLDAIFDRYHDGLSLSIIRLEHLGIIVIFSILEHIALISHGAAIGAIHQVLTGEWNYVGQVIFCFIYFISAFCSTSDSFDSGL